MNDFFTDSSLTLNGLFKPDTVRKFGRELLPSFSEVMRPMEKPFPFTRPESPCSPLDLHMSPKRNPPDDSITPEPAQKRQTHTDDQGHQTCSDQNSMKNSKGDQDGMDRFSLTPQQLEERAQEFLRFSEFGSKRKLFHIPVYLPEQMGMNVSVSERMMGNSDRMLGNVSDREVLQGYYKEMLIQKDTEPQCKQARVAALSNSTTAGQLVEEETRKPESYSPTSSPSENGAPDSPTSKHTSSPPSNSEVSNSQPSSPQPNTQVGPEQGSYPCSHCDKSFAYMGNLKRHIKMHHGEYRPFKCSLCVKRFWGNDSLEQHVKRVHSRFRPYECAHCDKKYSVCYDLQKHVRSVHGKDIDWNMEVPGVHSDGTGTNPGLGIHKVTGIKTQALSQLNHKCKFCGRGFATFNGLGVHLKMHFRCRVCLKGFNTESSLRIHLQKAHDITGEQEYVL